MKSAGYDITKRAFDIAVAMTVLVAFAPLMAIIAVGVFVTTGMPIVFKQERPGCLGRAFTLYKFRTMRHAPPGSSESDSARITRFGRFLRYSSLDELPELYNVLRGDMSLVGPRPLLMEYLPHYTAEEQLRHSIRPGLTGWAQVNGRNALSWDERLEMDVWYVQNRSFCLDMRILMMTLAAVAGARGVQTDPRGIMDDLHVERGRRHD